MMAVFPHTNMLETQLGIKRGTCTLPPQYIPWATPLPHPATETLSLTLNPNTYPLFLTLNPFQSDLLKHFLSLPNPQSFGEYSAPQFFLLWHGNIKWKKKKGWCYTLSWPGGQFIISDNWTTWPSSYAQEVKILLMKYSLGIQREVPYLFTLI